MLARRYSRPDVWLSTALALSLGATAWLFWPTLHDGLFADDFVAAAMLDGKFASPRAPLDLFNFADGTAEDVTRLRRLGSLPWWAPSDFRVSFMRPLSSALWHVDRALFGKGTGCSRTLARRVLRARARDRLLYRALVPGSIAAIAGDDLRARRQPHFPSVVSNRGGSMPHCSVCSLCSRTCAGAGRSASLRARKRARDHDQLLFGEWALQCCVHRRVRAARRGGPPRSRLIALLPSLVPAAVFLSFAPRCTTARAARAYIDPGLERFASCPR